MLARFKVWRVEVEKKIGKLVKCLRSDNGGEYTSREFKNYYEKNDIKHHYTEKQMSQQNGVAERMNRTLIKKVRSLRLQASLPKSFWGDALIFLLTGLQIESLMEAHSRGGLEWEEDGAWPPEGFWLPGLCTCGGN